jgi:hypothetical protein
MINQPNPGAYAAAPAQTADDTTYRSEPFEPAISTRWTSPPSSSRRP